MNTYAESGIRIRSIVFSGVFFDVYKRKIITLSIFGFLRTLFDLQIWLPYTVSVYFHVPLMSLFITGYQLCKS